MPPAAEKPCNQHGGACTMLTRLAVISKTLHRLPLLRIGIGVAFLIAALGTPGTALAVSWGGVWAGLAMVAAGVVLVVAAPLIAPAATAALAFAGIAGVVVESTAVVAAGYTLAVAGNIVMASAGLEKPGFLFTPGPIPPAAPPAPPAPPPPALLMTPVSMLPPPGIGSSASMFVADVNQTITAFNTMANDVTGNPAKAPGDFTAFTSSLETDVAGFNQVFDNVGANIPQLQLTQAQIDAAEASIGASCFPSAIATAFEEIGDTPAEMAALCSYIGNNPLAFAVPDVTPEELLADTGDLTLAPEPSSLGLTGPALCTLILLVRYRRRATPRRRPEQGMPPGNASATILPRPAQHPNPRHDRLPLVQRKPLRFILQPGQPLPDLAPRIHAP